MALESCSGILVLDEKKRGNLRSIKNLVNASADDIKVSSALIEKFGLRNGALIDGSCDTQNGTLSLIEIGAIQGLPIDAWRATKEFSTSDAIQPNQKITLVDKDSPMSMRMMDVFCPLGRGQRALIVAPPKAGKTRLLQELAHSVSFLNEELELMVLLIDERPEEVTDMKRTIRGEVFASSSDRPGEEHLKLATIVVDYAKRKVETGKHVVILMDSLTRMGRAFNVHQKGSGRTLSGGVDIRALEIPKRLFGAARQIEKSGSLTIIATALIETNSRMDELIFQEFKGTGNMELVLSRELSDERIFPAIDIGLSGTRNEELLFGDRTGKNQALRRSLAGLKPKDAMQRALEIVKQYN